MPDVRSLSEIEKDLLKAEEDFTDADLRYEEAERDRRIALDTINKHQAEFDLAIESLRKRSIAGSKWKAETSRGGEPLVLQPEDMAEDEPAASQWNPSPVAAEFERYRAFSHTERTDPITDPVLKVVRRPG